MYETNPKSIAEIMAMATPDSGWLFPGRIRHGLWVLYGGGIDPRPTLMMQIAKSIAAGKNLLGDGDDVTPRNVAYVTYSRTPEGVAAGFKKSGRDPDKLSKENQWNRRLFEEVKRWGANTIRVPIHPHTWRERGQADYLALIDQAVIWANELDIYLIIDWHSIGYLASGTYQHPLYVTDRQETVRFWHEIAYRYQGIPTTAAYELFNEPTTLQEPWGDTQWAEWKALNEQMIDVIYAMDAQVIPLVAGFNWAYDLTPIKMSPIDRPGIAYTCHPYPQKAQPEPTSKENLFALWEGKWGFASKTYPMICTELGWVQPDGYGAHVPVMNDGSYGPQIVEFMESRGISWTAWVFDPRWSPTMINDWDFTPSEQGAFFRQVMQAKANREPADH